MQRLHTKILYSLFSLPKCSPRKYSAQAGQAILNATSGQALITLLFFVIIGIMITSAAVILIVVNSLSTTRIEQGEMVYYIAESGMENALMRILRDPSYTGETLPVGNGSAVITVAGDISTKHATSAATLGNYKRTISVEVSYTNNVMTVLSWKEQ
jgi:hypothetical protein